MQVEKKSLGVKDFVENCDYPTRIYFTPKYFVTSPLAKTDQSLSVPSTTSVQISSPDYQTVDKKIDFLIEMIKSSAILVRSL